MVYICVSIHIVQYILTCPDIYFLPIVSEMDENSTDDTTMSIIHPLPNEICVKIFKMLSGASLHNCRQVKKSWNHFILQYIWKSEAARAVLSETLDMNWRDLNHTVVTEQYVNLPFHGFVAATSSTHVAVRTFIHTPLKNARIVIYDVSNRVPWEVPNLFQSILAYAQTDEFAATLNDGLLAIRVMVGEYVQDAQSQDLNAIGTNQLPLTIENVQVYSLRSNNKIFNENVVGLKQLAHSRSDLHSNFLVIFTHHFIQVVDFAQEENIVRSTISLDNSNYSSGSFSFPYFVLLTYNTQYDQNKMEVWKIHQDESGQVHKKFQIEDYNNFFTDEYGLKLSFHVTEVKYMECWFVAGIIPLADGTQARSMCLRIFKDNGMLTHQVTFPIYPCNGFINFFHYGSRLLVELENDVCVYEYDIERLNVQKINDPEIHENPGGLRMIQGLDFVTDAMVSKEYLAEARLVPTSLGKQRLRIQSLSFWKVH